LAVSAGFMHTCAIVTGGRLLCWGDNTIGQLGIGSSGDTGSSPVEVALEPGEDVCRRRQGSVSVCVCVRVGMYARALFTCVVPCVNPLQTLIIHTSYC
jgi:hypothetical protein